MSLARDVAIAFVLILSLPPFLHEVTGNILEAAEYARPAVIQIMVRYRADFTSPYPEFDLINGEFVFKPTADLFVERVETFWNGTGFIITPDGYAVTNAHVAGSEHYRKFGYLFEHAQEVTRFFLDQGMIGFEQYDRFLESYHSFLMKYGNFTSEEASIACSSSVGAFTVNVTVVGDPIGIRTSKDVAVLKLNAGKQVLPTVEFGDANVVSQNDSVVILGFPAEGESSDETLGVNAVEGKISGTKAMEGWQAFQTDAPLVTGYSGGPALDAQGKVVGVAAFGTISPLTQTVTNFLIPKDVVKELLEKAAIQARRSSLDEHYAKALEFLFRREFNAAAQEFSKVLELNPEHRYAKHYLRVAQTRGEDTNPLATVSTFSASGSTGRTELTRTVTRTVTRENPVTSTVTRTVTATVARQDTSGSYLIMFAVAAVVVIFALTIGVARALLKRRPV